VGYFVANFKNRSKQESPIGNVLATLFFLPC
jgi:hypothetical protein